MPALAYAVALVVAAAAEEGAPPKPDDAPASAPAAAPASSSPALDRERIQATIARALPDVRRCYEAGLVEKPEMAGKVLARFRVEPSGAVSHAVVVESELHDAAVEQCIVTVLKGLEHEPPSTGQPVHVTYPFSFSTAATKSARPPSSPFAWLASLFGC